MNSEMKGTESVDDPQHDAAAKVNEAKGSQEDITNTTRKQFQDFSWRDAVRYFKAMKSKFKLEDDTIADLEKEEIDGMGLLDMKAEEMFEVVKKRGRVRRVMRVLSSLEDRDEDSRKKGIEVPPDSKVAKSFEEKCNNNGVLVSGITNGGKASPSPHCVHVPSYPIKHSDEQKLDLETEYEIIQDLISACPKFRFSRWRASVEHIQNAIDSGCFCFHYCGHGEKEGLCIEGELVSSNTNTYLDGESLRKMFQNVPLPANRPKIVFLAACHSEVVGEKLIIDGLVNHAIVCRKEDKLDDNIPPIFAKAFYRRLLQGDTVLNAFERAKERLREIVKWRVGQALSILEGNVSRALSILKGNVSKCVEFEEVSKIIAKGQVPFGEEVYDDLFTLSSQKDVNTQLKDGWVHVFTKEADLGEEQKSEIKKLIRWAYVAQNEINKYKLLPCDYSDETHNIKYDFDFKDPRRHIQSKTGWIRAPASFFSRDLVREQYKKIVKNCRLTIKNDQAVLEKEFATQWVQIVGGKGTGKTALAMAVAWRMWHDNDGPNAIFWVDLPDFADKRGILSAVARSTSSDERQPLHALKNIAKSKRIMLICDNISILPGPSVFHEILNINKYLMLLSTSRTKIDDPNSLDVEMDPTLNKERFKKLFHAYLESTSIQCGKCKPSHFSTLYKDEKVGKDVRNPAMCMKMAKEMSRKDVPAASQSKKKLFEDKQHLVCIAKKLIEAEKKAEKKRLRAAMSFIPAPDEVPFFVGREDVVKKFFHELRDAGKQVHLLCGPGGIGKSQLAVRLFNTLIETGQYPRAYWLNCQTPEQLQIDYLRIAEKIPDLFVDKKDIKLAIQSIRERIETESCLLVFDDVSDSRAVAKFLPRTQGHVILTSRNSKTTDWSLEVKRWSINGFVDEDLVQLAGKFNLSIPSPKDDTKKCMEHLKTEFSGYPVVLAQFFSYCREMDYEVAVCIEQLRRRRRSLDEFLDESPKPMIEYPKSIVEVVRNCLDVIGQKHAHHAGKHAHVPYVHGKRALALLNWLAYLDPKNIPLELVFRLDDASDQIDNCQEDEKKGKQDFSSSETNTDTVVRKALALLEQYSLILWSRKTKHVSMHAVTQQIVRYLQPRPNLKNLVNNLIIYGGDFGDSHNNQEEWAAVFQHGRQLMTHTSEEEHSWELPQAIGQACKVACLYEKALSWFQGSANFAKNKPLTKSDKRAVIATCYSNIGGVYDSMGKYPEALKEYKKALNMQLAVFGTTKPHPDVASSYNNIGGVYKSMGKYPEALKEHKKALNMRLAVYGTTKPHPHVASSYNNIGGVYDSMGKYPEALKECKKALNMWLAVYGTTKPHPHVATSYSNIGVVYKSMGKYPEALKEHKKALNMRLAVYGTTKPHPHVATSYSNIGVVYNRMGKYPEALKEYKKAMNMQLAVYGTTKPRPDVASSYSNIGGVYDSMGKYPEALKEYKKVLNMQLAVYGTTKPRPHVATSYSNIGGVYDSMGKYPEALKEYKKVLNMQLAVYGTTKPRPHVASSYSNIGGVYDSMGKYPEALKEYKKALNMQLAVYGTTKPHPDVASNYSNIGGVYKSMGKYPEALKEYKKALNMLLAVYGTTKPHPHVASSYNNIGGVYDSMVKYPEALKEYKKALNMLLAVYGTTKPRPDVASSYSNIGGVYDSMGKYPEALKEYKKALNMLLAVYGTTKPHPGVVFLYERIAKIYSKLGNLPEACDIFKKLLSSMVACNMIFGEFYNVDEVHKIISFLSKVTGTDKNAREKKHKRKGRKRKV